MQLSAVFFDLDGALVDLAPAEFWPEAIRVIQGLDDRGLLSAILTATDSSVARSALESSGVVPHVLVCSDDVAIPKPEPAMILRACEVAGVPPWEVLMVGSSTLDRQAAAAAGCLFAGLGIVGQFTVDRLYDVLGIVDGAAPSS